MAARFTILPALSIALAFAFGCSNETPQQPSCTYSVASTSRTFSSAGGQGTVSLTTGPTCSWTTTADAPWVSFPGGRSGTGAATLAFAVASNSAVDLRTATLTVAGQALGITQEGKTPCEYSVSPVDSVLHWHGTSVTLSISTTAGCSWTATPSDGWLSLDRTSGTGSAVVTASFPQFLEDATRRATVQVRWPTPTAGQNVWVTQEGCRYGVDPAASFPASGGTRMATVVTQAISASCSTGCPWTATSNVPWIRVTSSMPRAGDDAFSYQVDANTGGARTGTITVAGRVHTVTQAGS